MFLFCFPVRCMMYGFGDEQVPFTESVDLLEDLVVEYITEMVRSLYLPRASHYYVMYQRTSQVRLWVIGTFTWDYQLFVKAKHPVNVQWLLAYPRVQSLAHCSSYYIRPTFQTTCNHQLGFLQLMHLLCSIVAGDADCDLLQSDLHVCRLESWQYYGQMEFNPSKCKIVTISHKKNPPQRIMFSVV